VHLLSKQEARKISSCMPFATLTLEQWEEMQIQVTDCLSRFVRAAHEEQASMVLLVGLEMLEIAQWMLLEAYVMGADLPPMDMQLV
jgi:hypothetical protein